MERFVRKSSLRLLLAIGLIGGSVWAFLPYMTHHVSNSAYVNAEIVRYSSPIPGRVALGLPPKGRFLDTPVILDLIKATAPDRRHLAGLELEYAVAESRARLLDQQLKELSAADLSLSERGDQLKSATLQRLLAELAEARAEHLACMSEEEERRQHMGRVAALAQNGHASRSRLDEARTRLDGVRARCQAADARIARLRNEQTAAQQGIYLRDGFNDVPYSQQQRDRLQMKRQDLESERLRERTRAEQLAREIEDEKKRMEQVNYYQTVLPANHVVWSIAASPGTSVTEGQTILDVANCSERFVVLELPERDFEAIRPGEKAAVRLLGSDEWLSGDVMRVRGSAARSDERLLAAQVPEASPRHITVEVSLPRELTPETIQGYCQIGRLAEVRMPRTGLHLISWIGDFLGVGGGESPATRSAKLER